GKKRAETRWAGDGRAVSSNDALRNLVRLLARQAAPVMLEQKKVS
ncbi:hypothetical protein LCGC14_3090370, partial [marine sediment metagenome]